MEFRDELDSYLKRLFPITRSITGDGNRETLKILQELIPLQVLEYPTGEEVFDWTIPKEWKIRDAWIKNSRGEKIVDFKNSNLHVVSYSKPIHFKGKLEEFRDHINYLKELPEAIPYRTSYYNENWGFSLSLKDFQKSFNEDETYELFIDSELFDGSLSIGELLIEGKTKKEYLISSYICHPSMANDSLSGVLVSAFLGRELLKNRDKLEHSYRIIFVPETIGAITYLANFENEMKKISSGLVVTTCGGLGEFGYKQSWEKDHFLNSLVETTFRQNSIHNFHTYKFDIHGSDERQYSSQGFGINCVTISKDRYYEYPEYHTSLDNLDFVWAENLEKSFELYLQLIWKMDRNIRYKNLYPNGEVMLSKHDLYPKTGGAILPNSTVSVLDIILSLLFYADGTKTLIEIAENIGVDDMEVIYSEAKKLEEKNILERV
jgi:aminopeptidase-like protein